MTGGPGNRRSDLVSVFSKPKAEITIELRLNGHDVRLSPDRFRVQDGDALALNVDVEIPVIQREDTVAGVKILRVREVIEPGL
jgi:hypothetical protein